MLCSWADMVVDSRKPAREMSSRNGGRSGSSTSSTVRRRRTHQETSTRSRIMGIVGAHPRLSAGAALVLLVLVSVLLVRMLSASGAKSDNPGDRLAGRFGWEWCSAEPPSGAGPPPAAPVETGKVRTVRQGARGIERHRARSKWPAG